MLNQSTVMQYLSKLQNREQLNWRKSSKDYKINTNVCKGYNWSQCLFTWEEKYGQCKYLVLGRDKFYFVQKNPLDSTKKFSETGIIKMHKCSFTTYLLCLVDVYFQQTVCIPMGFKCASLIVDFFLYSYEADFIQGNHSSGVMVTSLASLVVDREFEDQSKDYKIVICCFCAKHTSLSNKSKVWLVWNQSNVSEWNSMSSLELFHQWVSTITKHVGLVQSRHDHHRM